MRAAVKKHWIGHPIIRREGFIVNKGENTQKHPEESRSKGKAWAGLSAGEGGRAGAAYGNHVDCKEEEKSSWGKGSQAGAGLGVKGREEGKPRRRNSACV